MDRTGNKVGKYMITKQIGRGSFADVYEVRNSKKEKLALKMIAKNRSIYFESSNVSKEILAEIRVLEEIDHKFVLKFVEGFKDSEKGRWCIVTELCDGDLRERINEKIKSKDKFSEELILDWFAMMTMALEYIHAKNLLHRDLKPENVLCNHNNIIKLSDFGLSKFLENAAEGTHCGTAAYMAPEVDKRRAYHTECDIWSLGVLLYELCCQHADIKKTNKKIHSEYSKDLQTSILCMLEETPQNRLSASKLLQLTILKDRVAKFETKVNETDSTGSLGSSIEKQFKTDSGYSTVSSSTSATANRSSEKAFSFLEGVNPDTVSLIENEKRALDMVYSQSSGLIYVTSYHSVSGFKWDEKNKTFNKQFETSIKDKTELSPYSITLAPRDQIYISVENGDGTKYVYRLGGRELEKRVLLAGTKYIDDKCHWWILASNPDRHILIIHPLETLFIYILVREQKQGKVDLNQLHIPNNTWLRRIDLIGQLLILGNWRNAKIYMCELIVTKSDAFFKSGSERKPIESSYGEFAALSHVVGQQDEQLHLFTVRRDRHSDCIDILEYKLSLSVSGSEFSQLPMQPMHTLRVKREINPCYIVIVNTSSSVLIGRDGTFFHGNLSAIKLTKQHVTHHIQQSTQEHSEQHTRTAVNSECVIS